MIKNIYLVFTALVLIACTANKNEKKIAAINVEFELENFHEKFYRIENTEQLEDLKKEFPYLFPKNIKDETWFQKIETDQELFKIVDSTYNNLEEIKQELTKLYQHANYYFPSFKAPNTITVISDLDYNSPVIYADSLAFISLDMYLGKNSIVYSSFPKYIANNYERSRITVDLAKQIILSNTIFKRNRNFLSTMLYHGKLMYLNKLLNPSTPDHVILGITEEKHHWCLNNEAEIWKYFISNKLLFENDNSLNKRFIDLAPFSKFYLSNDKESPGGVGKFIGYQILKSYAANNNFEIHNITKIDENTFLKKSKYKPYK